MKRSTYTDEFRTDGLVWSYPDPEDPEGPWVFTDDEREATAGDDYMEHEVIAEVRYIVSSHGERMRWGRTMEDSDPGCDPALRLVSCLVVDGIPDCGLLDIAAYVHNVDQKMLDDYAEVYGD